MTDGVMMNRVVKQASLLITVLITVLSCTTVPKNIPTTLSEAEIKQAAQECSSNGDYLGAEKYYEVLIQRYGMNTKVLVVAEFELAHIYIKQKKWAQAKPILQRVINYYESDNGTLPGEYRKLAQIDLDKIPE